MKCQILLRFTLPVCVSSFFSRNTRQKKSQLPTVPGVYSCQRLDCTATNQPLSGKDGVLKAAASGRTDGYRAGCNFCQGYNHPCLWMSNWNVGGVEKTQSCRMRTTCCCTDFPNSAALDKVEYDLSVFTGCQRGNNVTVFRLKKKKKKRRNAGILK